MINGARDLLDRFWNRLGASSKRTLRASGGELKPYRLRLQKYLAGVGIEIGALHNRMPVDQQRATVRYVDRLSLADQRRHYPELAGYEMLEPDIVAEADRLPMLADASQDFVIANHLLEHLPDPIGALKEWFRVLRNGGILFLALPDKRLTFDKDRPRTTLQHLVGDHADRGVASRIGHFQEYSRLVHKTTGAALEKDVARLLATDYSIHFHVWIPEDISELLGHLRTTGGVPWEIVEQVENTGSDEFIFVLRKSRQECQPLAPVRPSEIPGR
jgi:SAM-dependent methyltransferase